MKKLKKYAEAAGVGVVMALSIWLMAYLAAVLDLILLK